MLQTKNDVRFYWDGNFVVVINEVTKSQQWIIQYSHAKKEITADIFMKPGRTVDWLINYLQPKDLQAFNLTLSNIIEKKFDNIMQSYKNL